MSLLYHAQEPKSGAHNHHDNGSRRSGFPTRRGTFVEGNFSTVRLLAFLPFPSTPVTRVDAFQAAFSALNYFYLEANKTFSPILPSTSVNSANGDCSLASA